MLRIELLLHGVDLRDKSARDSFPDELANVHFEARGPISLAIVVTDSTPAMAVTEATDVARKIHELMPGACVQEVFAELVSISEIAARCDVTPESVRLWSTGKRRADGNRFPDVKQSVQSAGPRGRAMNLYAWVEIVDWVRASLGFDPEDGFEFLSARHLSDLNWDLIDLRESEGLSRPSYWPMRTRTLRFERSTTWASMASESPLVALDLSAVDPPSVNDDDVGEPATAALAI